MDLVKLKMKGIYKAFLTIIGILILLIALLGVFYIVYNNVKSNTTDIEVNNSLSINYIDGKDIDIEKNKTIKFSITNDGNEINYYNIGFTNIKGSASYVLRSNNEIIFSEEINKVRELYTDYMMINPNETNYYELEINNTGKNNFQSSLEIKVKETNNTIFADKILSDNEIKEPKTKIGIETASESEGLIKENDDLGTTYYFRGKIDNNYVLFGGLRWRIIRINGDNTVRLILDSETTVVSNFYNEKTTNYDYNTSVMKNYLNDWLSHNLNDNLDYIVNAKYCFDIVHDNTYNFNAYTRLLVNKIPTFNCLGEVIDTNVGLITADEVIFAGAVPTLPNKEYYLYLDDASWPIYTMSGAKGDQNSINMFMIDKDGSLATSVNSTLLRGVRPVITLLKKTVVTGSGTRENPYKIENA